MGIERFLNDISIASIYSKLRLFYCLTLASDRNVIELLLNYVILDLISEQLGNCFMLFEAYAHHLVSCLGS